MRRPSFVLACVIAVVATVGIEVRGQSPSSPGKVAGSKPMRTPWGDPDLQGIWNNSTTTRLERPAALGTKELLTDEEITDLAEQIEREFTNTNQNNKGQATGAYDYAWMDEGKPLKRTSLIVDPTNGRLPLTSTGAKARAEQAASGRGLNRADSWEDVGLATRCLTRGAPKLPGGYNNNFLILQTPGQVTIVQEMIHEVRIIPVDGRPHLHPNIRQWLGDSRGHWEGDTLVVETTNYKVLHDSPNCCPGAGPRLHVVERFRRIDAGTIDFSYTATDPSAYTQPWTASVPMVKVRGPMFEYACHESNYGLAGILRGARAQDAKRQATESK